MNKSNKKCIIEVRSYIVPKIMADLLKNMPDKTKRRFRNKFVNQNILEQQISSSG